MDKLPNSWVTKRETNYICYQVGRITCDIFLLLEQMLNIWWLNRLHWLKLSELKVWPYWLEMLNNEKKKLLYILNLATYIVIQVSLRGFACIKNSIIIAVVDEQDPAWL